MAGKRAGRSPKRITLDRNRRARTASVVDDVGALPAAAEQQRVDRWLWHARLVRTRGAAAALAGAGYVRVNGARVEAPSRPVRMGDVITVALDRSVRVLRVRAFAARRGPAPAAANLYEELS
jgi:ribosome-associated heat shock protein Hsp15